MVAEAILTLYGSLPRAGPGSDACTREALVGAAREIALYRAHGSSYGYVFYLLRRDTAAADGRGG